MGSVRKEFALLLISLIIFSSLILLATISVGLAQSGTSASTISFLCVTSTRFVNFNVSTIGRLVYNGVGISNAVIQFSYKANGASTWQFLSNVNTSYAGSFSFGWNASVSVNYVINATWPGNDNYPSASTIANFTTTTFNNQNSALFSVNSNSTITNFAFDSSTNELSFGVSGPPGTTGYAQVGAPELPFPDFPTNNGSIMLDGVPTSNYDYQSVGDTWSIDLMYNQSSHIVVIELGPASTSTPTQSPSANESNSSLLLIISIALVIIAFLLATIIFLLLRMRKQKTINSR